MSKTPKTLFDQMAEQRRIIEESQRTLADLEAKSKGEMKEALEAYAQETFGMSVAKIMGFGSGHKLAGKKFPVLYRNPNDPSEEWTGRGVVSNWLRPILDEAGIDHTGTDGVKAAKAWLDKSKYSVAKQDAKGKGKETLDSRRK